MDQPELDAARHRRALAALRRINAICGIDRAVWGELARIASQGGGQPLRVLDVASGGGDITIRLARQAARHGMPLEISGCDISLTAVEHANAAAARAGFSGLHFFQHDVLEAPLPEAYDVVMCTLFLHHLEESAAETVLRQMAAACRRAVVVDDLIRSRSGYLLAWLGSRLLTRSPIVHVDGPLSVRAAFTVAEARQLAERAGLRGATIRRHWPQRFLLSWWKA
jgi:2-polyprenyl-3-methyl-5-hydroxy-6-metoxy-1,4-benzoquinol methylase